MTDVCLIRFPIYSVELVVIFLAYVYIFVYLKRCQWYGKQFVHHTSLSTNLEILTVFRFCISSTGRCDRVVATSYRFFHLDIHVLLRVAYIKLNWQFYVYWNTVMLTRSQVSRPRSPRPRPHVATALLVLDNAQQMNQHYFYEVVKYSQPLQQLWTVTELLLSDGQSQLNLTVKCCC